MTAVKTMVAIKSYKRKDSLMKCLNVARNLPWHWDTWVFDDASGFSEDDWIEIGYGLRSHHIVVNSQNIGIAEQNNRILERFLENHYKCLVMMDDDCQICDYKKFLATTQDISGHFAASIPGVSIQTPLGCCLAVDRSSARRLGGFRTDYHPYGEIHLEYWARAVKAGICDPTKRADMGVRLLSVPSSCADLREDYLKIRAERREETLKSFWNEVITRPLPISQLEIEKNENGLGSREWTFDTWAPY